MKNMLYKGDELKKATLQIIREGPIRRCIYKWRENQLARMGVVTDSSDDDNDEVITDDDEVCRL